MSELLEITLFGERVAVKAEGDTDLIREAMKIASIKVHEAEGRSKPGSAPHKVAILALLDLAEEYVRAKKRVANYRQAVTEKAEALQGSPNPNQSPKNPGASLSPEVSANA